MNTIEIICDSHHGMYIPQIMAERLASNGWKGISKKNIEDCQDPTSEWYWYAWNTIENNAEYIDDSGVKWYLHHDGDLFAVSEKHVFEEI